MVERYSCAREARARAEPVHGTASPVRRWLLLEQDGPWGREALLESRLDPAVARALAARARALKARPLLIRRHGRARKPGQPGYRAYAAISDERSSWIEEFRLDTPAALVDVDLGPLGSDRPSGGRRVDGPLYLVCTNGRHDACCAEYGRPLARALAAAHPESTWESSHVGGDRFAGNLVCLPEGVYYGHVGPLEAARIAAAHADGRIVLDHYRGRSCHAPVVQAADYFTRRETGLDRFGDLSLVDAQRGPGGVRRVTLAAADGSRYTVEVAVAPEPVPQRLTCTAHRDDTPPRFTLRSLDREAGSVTGSSCGPGTASPPG